MLSFGRNLQTAYEVRITFTDKSESLEEYANASRVVLTASKSLGAASPSRDPSHLNALSSPDEVRAKTSLRRSAARAIRRWKPNLVDAYRSGEVAEETNNLVRQDPKMDNTQQAMKWSNLQT